LVDGRSRTELVMSANDRSSGVHSRDRMNEHVGCIQWSDSLISHSTFLLLVLVESLKMESRSSRA
jgi:hypothetical protein